ncbi:ABC transporter substrate-binding protein [Bradyrhizobium glycinis]|uniref:ABC transporter substrate-binding protein n=1 Tax=Bradyrhizobium glycinis TaxID=2751812 RepID=UPI0018D8927B|nr:ABC transporter substrate-binding protein [Bradyrhizobium glycinis]MBH5367277.1 ABC transporter substrate-binding protein [Bradyrhizobium glycinis]
MSGYDVFAWMGAPIWSGVPFVSASGVRPTERTGMTSICSIMHRRQALRLAAGAALGWQSIARADDAAPVIGFLDPRGSADDFAAQFASFHRGLRERGFIDGENLTIAYEWGGNSFDRLPALAKKLVQRPLSLIVASGGSRVALIARAETSEVPIVFLAADDPVKLGLAASLARPGGNMTGINYFNVQLYAKRLDLLCKLAPGLSRVAVLVNPADTAAMAPAVGEVEAAAPAMRLKVVVVKAENDREIEACFKDLRQRADALYVGGDAFLHSRRAKISALATANGLPAAYPQREWAEAGGLMSYGTNFSEIYKELGNYVGRILNGDKAGELPIQQPSRFELVFNLKAAKALDLAIPPMLLALADDVVGE